MVAPSVEISEGRPSRSLPPRHPPNYKSNIVQDALEHLASIDLNELCNEAKNERCRATRDLSSCGRFVQHVLNSCGHASLCAECSQRCDACPICRTSIPNNSSKVRLRLYYKCIEAGLISKRHDDRFQEKEENGEYLMADIQRLYALFDVALENNLVSLICHYVTDVCMDESAVSSDPILAFLLDEVVVKDWCKRTFKNIIYDLHEIYILGVEAMKSNLCLLQKLALQLTGISNVLEVMDSSFEGASAQLHDLHQLIEKIVKAKQHLEVMIWCARHQFLENIQSRYLNSSSWAFNVHERKSAAVDRSWPGISSNLAEHSGPHGPSLFIEQALSNLGIGQTILEKKEEVDIYYLQDINSPIMFQSMIDEADTCMEVEYYPFKTLRAAIDILFLHGTSDMVVAKQAIFLYYLFDRHWTRPDLEWKHLIDDFAACFGLNRNLLLESLIFYLLDDHTDQALKEACCLLPEIAGPETHMKIAQVLLERQRPDVALTVLRCTGRDTLQCVSVGEAVTAVRVRIECGLLTEAFMYQRTHCSKMKEENSKGSNSDSWIQHVEVLVTEICYLCIRRNLVDRMIELPWDFYEEKYLDKCLFDHACQDPSRVYGNLLMVFYLQRYRYIEAYHVDRKLQKLEQNVTETADVDAISKIRSISQWRSKLVDKCLKLLSEVQRVQVMTGNMDDSNLSYSQDIHIPPEVDFSSMPSDPRTLLPPSSTIPSIVLDTNFNSSASRKPSSDSAMNLGSPPGNAHLETGKMGPSVLQRKLHALGTPNMTKMHSAINGFSSSNRQSFVNQRDDVIESSLPIGTFSCSSSQMKESRVSLKDSQFQRENNSHGMEPYEYHPLMRRVTDEDDNDLMDTFHNNGFPNESVRDQNRSFTRKQPLVDKHWNTNIAEEANKNLWSFGKSNSPLEYANMTVGSRWRSDESSEDEADLSFDGRIRGGASIVTRRRARLSRR